MKKLNIVVGVFCGLCVTCVHGQSLLERLTSAEAADSRLPEVMYHIADVYGPRLTGSPNEREAAKWAVSELTKWHLSNAHLEHWNFGHRGWTVETATAQILYPVRTQLTLIPEAWTPSTKGTISGAAVLIAPPQHISSSALSRYLAPFAEKLRGKIVLVGGGASIPGVYKLNATRLDHETVRGILTPRRIPDEELRSSDVLLTKTEWERQLNKFLVQAGGVARVNDSDVPNGEIRVQGNRDFGKSAILPTAAIRNDDYSRLARFLDAGVTPRLRLQIVNQTYASGTVEQNVVAELPGSDKAQQVVLLGAHLDSWHGATGATDNGIGCAIMMEALRILQLLGVQPKRTIRVVLFSGEEQGLLGSQAYVVAHYGTAESPLPAFKDLDAYLNIDSGSGRIRTVNVFGPPAASETLQEMMAPLQSVGFEGAVAHGVRKLRSTDATTFSRAGLPSIGLTQDPLDYEDVTWHTNLDDMNHVNFAEARIAVEEVAWLAWQLANSDSQLQRFTPETMPSPFGPAPFSLEAPSRKAAHVLGK